MSKFITLFFFLAIHSLAYTQQSFSGYLRVVYSPTFQTTFKIAENGHFVIPMPEKGLGVYEPFEIYFNLPNNYQISTTDYDNIITVSKQTNRVDVSLGARARNVKKAINIVVAQNTDLPSTEPLYYVIQVKATAEPIKKENLDYLEKKIKALDTKIVMDATDSGIFKYRYHLDEQFKTRIEAKEFLNKLKLCNLQGFVVPYFK
jgi:hypothetical protein